MSFITHGHRFILYSYNDVENAPAGCEIEDARRILAEDRAFFYKHGLAEGTVAGFTNLFRYKLLYDRGGWWVDTDVLCLSHDIPEAEYVFALQGYLDRNDLWLQHGAKQDHVHFTTYGTAILKTPRAAPLAARGFARAEELGSDIAQHGAGPPLLTQLIRELGVESEAWEPDELYPLAVE